MEQELVDRIEFRSRHLNTESGCNTYCIVSKNPQNNCIRLHRICYPRLRSSSSLPDDDEDEEWCAATAAEEEDGGGTEVALADAKDPPPVMVILRLLTQLSKARHSKNRDHVSLIRLLKLTT